VTWGGFAVGFTTLQEMMSFWQELLPILIGQSADDVKQRKNGLLDAESNG
jgi:hypothetical protein